MPFLQPKCSSENTHVTISCHSLAPNLHWLPMSPRVPASPFNGYMALHYLVLAHGEPHLELSSVPKLQTHGPLYSWNMHQLPTRCTWNLDMHLLQGFCTGSSFSLECSPPNQPVFSCYDSNTSAPLFPIHPQYPHFP